MAGERSFFFDGEDKLYNSQDFAQLFDMFFGTGVVKGYMDELSMGPLTNGMKVVVNKGCAVICGRGYIIDGVKIFTHDPAHTTLDRIDRIILHLNLATRSINLMIKKGAIADVPVPPALQQDDMNNGGIIYELPIAQVRITKGKAYIDSTQITDDRSFCDLQGQTGLYAKKQLEPRKTPKFYNQWVDYVGYMGGAHEKFRYWKDDFGMVHMQGSAWGGMYGNQMAVLQLDEGYRPEGNLYFSTTSVDGKPQFMELKPNGMLVFTAVFSSTTASMIMGPVSFRPAGV
ncbi:structural protein [Bacillus cereus]|nr:structural protein [Bacillus cereus]